LVLMAFGGGIALVFWQLLIIFLLLLLLLLLRHFLRRWAGAMHTLGSSCTDGWRI
jgi:hypothetical protein